MRTFKPLSLNMRWMLTNMIVWSVTKQMFVAIKLWGIESTPLKVLDISPNTLWLAVGCSGLIDGVLFTLADRCLDARVKLPFAQMVATKALIHALLAVSLSIAVLPLLAGSGYLAGIDVLTDMLLSTNLVVSLFIIFSTTLLLQGAQQVSLWLRHENLSSLFRESHVKEEERIFLFLDMRSSTQIAESLGAMKYSQLVQDCFADLYQAVQQTGAHIYQYVGDEAVLTWKSSPDNFVNAVRMHFAFARQLEQNAPRYCDRFNLVPAFKGGIHHGMVVKAHVGVMHKELAYHGDVINTAARIQSKCNDLMRDLLVSDSFRERLPQTIPCEWEGSFALRGKCANMNLYSISRGA